MNNDLEIAIKENILEYHHVFTFSELIDMFQSINFNYNLILSIKDYNIKKKNIDLFQKNIFGFLNQNKVINLNKTILTGIVVYFSAYILPKKTEINGYYNLFLDMLKLLEIENKKILINILLNEIRFPSKQTIF